jgi:hypothetical protein
VVFGIAASSSARGFFKIIGLLIRWNDVTVNAQAVVSSPAPIMSWASSPRWSTDFSCGGRSLLSNS